MVAAPEGGHSPLSGVFSAISPVDRWVRVGEREWRVGHVRVAQRRRKGRHPRPPRAWWLYLGWIMAPGRVGRVSEAFRGGGGGG